MITSGPKYGDAYKSERSENQVLNLWVKTKKSSDLIMILFYDKYSSYLNMILWFV